MNYSPIGFIKTPFKERFGTPRQPGLVPSAPGHLQLLPALGLNGAFTGLEGFSHVWLIFEFHQNVNKRVHAKVHPPRLQGETTGLFATRSPHRPNPIGLSVVKLEKIEGDTLHLSGVDLVDGTPILDIKPYLPSSDCLPDATGGWTASRPERSLTVHITEEVLSEIRIKHRADIGMDPERYIAMIRESLELDPRPDFYKGTPENPDPYMTQYGIRLGDFNVAFRMESSSDATVIQIQPWAEYVADDSRRKNRDSS